MDLELCGMESSRRGRRRSGSGRMVPSSMTYPRMGRHRVFSVITEVLEFGSYKKLFKVSVMILLVLTANSNVFKVSEARLKTILIYKLHHLSLSKQATPLVTPEGQEGELIEIASSFKGCVRLVFLLEWHLDDMHFKDQWC